PREARAIHKSDYKSMSFYPSSLMYKVSYPLKSWERLCADPRPVYNERFALNIGHIYISPISAIVTLIPVITHDKKLVLRDKIWTEIISWLDGAGSYARVSMLRIGFI